MFCKYMRDFSITYVCPVKRRCNLTCYHCIDNNVEISKIKPVCASPKQCSNQKIFGVHSHYRRWHQMVGWRNKKHNLKIFQQRWKHPSADGKPFCRADEEVGIIGKFIHPVFMVLRVEIRGTDVICSWPNSRSLNYMLALM